MEVAASTIAVIQLSATIISLCTEYLLAVKDAKSDIASLQGEVKSLWGVLEEAEPLLTGSGGTRSFALIEPLDDCHAVLKRLCEKLESGGVPNTAGHRGIRRLIWPFKSKEVDKVIRDLERCKQTLSLALQVRQTAVVLNVDQKITLAKLPIVEGATYDSYSDEINARCHKDTRTDLLSQIQKWAYDLHGKPIYWLNGMAGTGKSTIARTVAQASCEDGQLGASFFFKRGEGDRGNASRFFTTIASQLAVKIPAMITYIGEAIDADPIIFGKALKEQFEKLILRPLSKVQRAVPARVSKMLIVIDALDECERDDDIARVLHLISQTDHLGSLSLRFFITSRPELPVRLGFGDMESAYRDFVLHEIPRPMIEHDLYVYLESELANIRESRNRRVPPDRSLPPGWPGEQTVRVLAEMAAPLFIFAATLRRFIGDPRWSPEGRLATILQYQTVSQASKLDGTYLPVLNQLLAGLTNSEKADIAKEFRDVVGPIVILAEPLSTTSLSRLLAISKELIDCRLDLLHSVLSVPENQGSPVRLLHLSFRDFLVDPEKRGKNPFWIDEKKTHETIAIRCLELMSGPGGLREDICKLNVQGGPSSGTEGQSIHDQLPAEVRYACQYWVYHLARSDTLIRDDDRVYWFLQKHFLHWLEALGLMRRISESITLLGVLQWLVAPDESGHVSRFLYDSTRFVLRNRCIIDTAPLQLYASAIVFAPERSVVKNTYRCRTPSWIRRPPKVEADWAAMLQTLEGHTSGVYAVDFSPDCRLLASASANGTVKLWNPATGAELQTLKGHDQRVNAVALSPNSKFLASGSYDGSVILWNPDSGSQIRTLEGHAHAINAVAFSPGSSLILASASGDSTIKLWDPVTGAELRTLKGHSREVNAVAFSPDGKLLASASCDKTVKLWDTATGAERQTLKNHTGWVDAVAFSPGGKLLASASDETVKLWNLATGAELRTLEGHTNQVQAVAFSPDSKLLASASCDRTVRLWDPAAGIELQTLKGHTDWALAVAFSPDGKMLASASVDGAIKLWDPAIAEPRKRDGHTKGVLAVTFSPDAKLLASASSDSAVKLWDSATGAERQTFEGHADRVLAVAFSLDSKLLASASDDKTIKLWNPATGVELQTLKGHANSVLAVAFSPHGELLASASADSTAKLWDPVTGAELQTLKGHRSWVDTVAFSPDSKLLASASYDRTIKLWDLATGMERYTLKGHKAYVSTVVLSPDGRLLASASYDKTVRLWDPATGTRLQTLEGHIDPATAVTFSLDSKLLMSKSSKDTKFWDTATGINHQTPEGPSSPDRHLRLFDHIYIDQDWVVRDGKKVLWLPPDYRPSHWVFEYPVLALGCPSGLVLFIEFSS